ncbi:hypothetical protein E2C01_098511 [Portunus trituberculatus]|uniref:Uncharacterized protein n=1 Tax=Portunus trituberculatus TaxID=210409 RepID=A0A5B7JY05_PORTR|nr:hypothetical protein [Portunus trituberculatus]
MQQEMSFCVENEGEREGRREGGGKKERVAATTLPPTYPSWPPDTTHARSAKRRPRMHESLARPPSPKHGRGMSALSLNYPERSSSWRADDPTD